MDVLESKRYEQYDYTNRYTSVPYYYHTEDNKDIYGVGSNLVKTTAWVAHEVLDTDTLDALSLKYYGNPTYWWVIAYFNDIQDAFMFLPQKFRILKIPSISSIEFGASR